MPQMGMRILYSALQSWLPQHLAGGRVEAEQMPHRAQRIGAVVVDRSPMPAARPRSPRPNSRSRTRASTAACRSVSSKRQYAFALLRLDEAIGDVDTSPPATVGPL